MFNRTTTIDNQTTDINTSSARTDRPSGVAGMLRTRWAAIGAAVAVSIGGGGIGLVHATVDSGERPVLVMLDSPCRLMDSRPGSQVGPRATPIGADETYTLDAHGVNGDCDLPVGATALSTNVTAVNATQQTNLRFFGGTGPVPTAANMNPGPGQPPAPNAVTVDVDNAGQFSVFNKFGSVDVVIDVVGYYEHHTHDERYVEHSEMRWVVVDHDGSVERRSFGIDDVERISEGYYQVTFTEDISNCVYQATAGRPGANIALSPRFPMVANWVGDPEHAVAVFMKDQDGMQNDYSFHLNVICTPQQVFLEAGLGD